MQGVILVGDDFTQPWLLLDTQKNGQIGRMNKSRDYALLNMTPSHQMLAILAWFSLC